MNSNKIPLAAAFFLLVLTTFCAGMLTADKNWLPWQTAETAREMWRSYRATGRILRKRSYVHRNDAATDQRYKVSDPDALANGALLISRIDPATQVPIADLIDATGAVLHSWPIDYSRMIEGGARDDIPHAATPLADGSLLVSFDDGHALTRIDACGNPIWVKNDMVYHHVISRGADGYWAWADPAWDGGHNQYLVRFNPETGETVEKISLLLDIIPASAKSQTDITLTEDFPVELEADPDATTDILHPNDIDELTPELAPQFPEFKAGDLLVSMRNINLVAVIDRQSHAVLWAQYGPWRNQHDPDFEKDGTISVYSNNWDRNRSTLISIDPKTNLSRDLFQGTGLWFSSYVMGNHESLPNGNWLIASPMEGRVIEATADGRVVREFNNILDENYNSVLSSAEFVNDDFFLPTHWNNCGNASKS